MDLYPWHESSIDLEMSTFHSNAKEDEITDNLEGKIEIN